MIGFIGSVINIRTWSVKTLYQAGEVQNSIHKMKNTRKMVITEIKWLYNMQLKIEEYRVFHSGNRSREQVKMKLS